MRWWLKFGVLSLIVPGTAFAVDQTPPETPMCTAVGLKLNEEINSEMNFRAALITAQAKIKEQEAEIEQLKKSVAGNGVGKK